MKNTKQEYTVHPAAEIFPMIDPVAFEELKADIKEHGQRESGVLYKGQVIDGRNRYKACQELGIEARFCDIDEEEGEDPIDPVAYVLSLNLHRRHLTKSQWSMCAARAREIYERQAKERQQGGQGGKLLPANLPEANRGDARDKAGKAFGVSGKSVDQATRVIEKGTPELAKAVDDGKIAVSVASAVTAMPKEDQVAIVAKGPAAVKEAVKASAKAKPKAKPKAKAVDQQNEWVDVDDEDEIEESSPLATDIDDDSLSAEIHVSQNATASRGQEHIRQTQLSLFIVRWNQYQETDKQDILEWLRKKYPQA